MVEAAGPSVQVSADFRAAPHHRFRAGLLDMAVADLISGRAETDKRIPNALLAALHLRRGVASALAWIGGGIDGDAPQRPTGSFACMHKVH